MTLKIKGLELVALILMLIPGVALIGLLIYVIFCGALKGSFLKLLLAILSLFFGIFASIWLWLDAFSIINIK